MGKLKNSNKWLSLCNSFSGGIFFGAALLHLFVDSISQLQNVISYPIAPLCLCAGFLITFFLELFLHIYLERHPKLLNSNINNNNNNNNTSSSSTILHHQHQHINNNNQSTLNFGNTNSNTTFNFLNSPTNNRRSMILDRPSTPNIVNTLVFTPPPNHRTNVDNDNECTPMLSDHNNNNNNDDDDKEDESSDSGDYIPSSNHSSIYFQDALHLSSTSIQQQQQEVTKQETTLTNQNYLLPFILVFGLSVHSLFEGLAFGLQSTVPKILDLLVAVFSHKLLASFALGVSTIIYSRSLVKMILILFIFSISSPIGASIGIVLVDYSQIGNVVPPILQGLASGTFLYISLVEIIPKEIKSDSENVFIKCLLLLLGWSLMAVIAIWI
ncbi:zinc/iron permease [Cavenderia fasciculata]|uniref:Zinc/iron permease n=1 Tax=Cavenderia fasciculata TaxID=261658 RepID=F4PPR6_CACFS|nr:zinc/iron permease [Cavenderia fasciculata]EGG22379.1 zinc/iron permease [Cavenderia fasciculata]|eukprot:XP_004360230.1 zinc/iron permease [Cavenderia fasciculata]